MVPPTSINCGLPQGSPVSAILFMLYISPIFKLDSLKGAFGYADDIAILKSSSSLEENSQQISTAINQAQSWGTAEGISFAPDKSDLLHFTRRHKDKGISPPVVTNTSTITENLTQPYLKWLRVHFDRKLSFKYHVRIQTSKALKVANSLRCLGKTTRGVLPRLSRQAVAACVLPIAYFAAETWWPGKTRAKGIKTINNRVGSHVKLLDKVQSAAARAILPVYRTTPIPALLRESGFSTAQRASVQ